MIYTLTLNPALDVYADMKEFNIGRTNRVKQQFVKIGGKGINVSYALKKLGIPSIPIVALGGFIGDYIEEALNRDFQPFIAKNDELTRINYKMKVQDVETEMNSVNCLCKDCLNKLKQFLSKLNPDDLLIACGTGKLEDYDFLLNDLNCKLILDVKGSLLKHLVRFHPILVKPNQEELLEISLDRNEAYAFLLKYCQIILYTLGENGAIIKTKEEEHFLPVKRISLKSSVGCGDAFLAGFLKVYLENGSLEACLEFAQACASYRANTNEFYFLEKTS